MNITAEWIWSSKENIKDYNQTVIFRKAFALKSIVDAKIAITADSYYRLSINGKWINDGPCRSYPEHYQYDIIDVSAELKEGINTIAVTAKYFGIGTMHQIPQQAGLLAQLEVIDIEGNSTVVKTDSSWEAAEYINFISNTPKISIQQGPFELFDAQLQRHSWMPVNVLCNIQEGPWKDLNPRDCRLLTRKPFAFKRFVACNLVSPNCWSFSVPAQKLLYPGNTKSNATQCLACGVAFVINSPDERIISVEWDNFVISVNGKISDKEKDLFNLREGENLLFCLTKASFTHDKDLALAILNPDGLEIVNPVNPTSSDICYIRFSEFSYDSKDIPFSWAHEGRKEIEHNVSAKFAELLEQINSRDTFLELLQDNIMNMPREKFSRDEAFWSFKTRECVGYAQKYIDAPENLIYSSGEMTSINPDADNDIELIYDLCEQNCGFWEFELIADAGTIVDIFAVEYIADDGDIQHTHRTRNGMRYICKQGINHYTSLKRRSGRFLFITIRNQKSPVRFKYFQLIESTYPVDYKGSFECSDDKLNRIWEISARTMKLCMEDTFTDCPLYEQTLWVGDARNEALFAYPVFGAWDLARRCIKLAGLSLEHYPITGCQVPSGWDCLLPAWSFMWGISVWEYYFETADRMFLNEAWKWVEKNIDGALGFIDSETGLFCCEAWNLFDWSRTDGAHKIVIFNTMFLIGAIDAAVKCAEVLGNSTFIARIDLVRKNLVKAVNCTWDFEKQAFPDSLDYRGNFSQDISMHTSFLSILYDIIDGNKFDSAKDNTVFPRENMIKVSSPFASLYLYETFEKLNMFDEIIAAIYRDYSPMLARGASTVWETFAETMHAVESSKFPSRSHCHGWSATPLLFLNSIILGLRMTAAGGKEFTVSPWVTVVNYATGSRATVNGPVKISWRRSREMLTIKATAPEEVKLNYLFNETHNGLKVIFNGKIVQERVQKTTGSVMKHDLDKRNSETQRMVCDLQL